MSILYLVVQQTMFFSIPLLIVALGGVFTERSGVTNIALDGMMIMGAFTSIFFINQMQSTMSGQLLLLIAILIAVVTGVVFSLLHAYASVNMKSDQIISGTALNLFAPAFAIYVARMIQENGVQQITFSNTFRISSV
ncbi:MAG: ABC transporter permease, partial [Clostridiales bacterium]|nr:ABC transporter permease [Clostridiales bacterium]